MDAEDKAKLIKLIQEHDGTFKNLVLDPKHLNFLVSVFWPKIADAGCTSVGVAGDDSLIPLVGGLLHRASLAVGKLNRLRGFFLSELGQPKEIYTEEDQKCALILGVTIQPEFPTWGKIEMFNETPFGKTKITKIFSIIDCDLGWKEHATHHGFEFEALLQFEDVKLPWLAETLAPPPPPDPDNDW